MSDRNYYHRGSTRAMPMPMVPMPMPSRAKSVTDPLDDRVKARLIRPDSGVVGEGYASSSGSEHEGLSGVLRIDGFFFDDSDEDDGDRRGRQLDDDDAGWSDDDKEDEEEDDDSNGKVTKRRPVPPRSAIGDGGKSTAPSPFGSLSKHSAAVIRDMMRISSSPALVKDPFRRGLLAAVLSAVQRNRKQHDTTTTSSCDGDKAASRRAVMCTLRDAGYNAGVCKSRWAASSGVTAGTYEYIDVVRSTASPLAPVERYIVDVGFGGEFEIARPTEEYARVAAELPAVYVGRPDELKPALRVQADAAKRSLRESGMHVPPWRKLRYVLAKWLGPFKRTINVDSASTGASSSYAATPAPQRLLATEIVQCRAVGFQQPATLAMAPATTNRLPTTSAVHCRAVGFQQPATFTIGLPLGRTR